MKTIRNIVAALLLAALASTTFAAPSQFTQAVSATQTSSTVTFGFEANVVVVNVTGSSEAFIKFNGTAIADTTGTQILAGRGKRYTFRRNDGVTTMGVICSSGETTTVVVDAYKVDQDQGFNVEDIRPSQDTGVAFTVDDITANDDGVIGDDLTVTDAASVGGTLAVTGVATLTAAPVLSSTTASRLLVVDASKGLTVNGSITTNAVPRSASSGATLVASALSDDGTTVTSSRPVSVTGNTTTSGLDITTPTAQTVASDGAGTAAAFNMAATVGKVWVTCNDTDGCAATLLETSAVSGASLTVVNVTTNAVTFADTSGVSETVGALSLGQWDLVRFEYVVDRWVQATAVVNN